MNKTLTQARKDVNRHPTDGQKKAGNYAMGHVNILGFNITIENPKGSYRSGKDDNGKTWKTLMNNDYGYFTKTKGYDGDAIDVFIGPNLKSEKIYAVDQILKGKFDETKVMLGFNSKKEAEKAYFSNYEKDWKGFGKITGVDKETFKKWLYDGYKQKKPFYKYVEFKGKTINENFVADDDEYDEDYEHPYYGHIIDNDAAEVFRLFKQWKETGENKLWDTLINPAIYQRVLIFFTQQGSIPESLSNYPYQWMRIIMRNTAVLKATTAIAGHDMYFPTYEFIQEFFDDDRDKWKEYKKRLRKNDDYYAATVYLDKVGFYDNGNGGFCVLPDGSNAWSDYGIGPLEKIISEYNKSLSPEQVLVLVNKCLDIVHCRGDLSSAFIVGGRKTLSAISSGQYLTETFTKSDLENKVLKENKLFINKKHIMRKNKIRLTESQLHRVIRESVRRVLRESDLDANNKFDYVGKFREGFAVVELNGMYNFINTEGQLVSPDQWFDYVGDFRKGFAAVSLNGKWNHINTKGQMVSNWR